MRIPRVYVDLALTAGQEITLDGPAHHHLIQVLRLKVGAPLILFNGRGGEYTATLTQAARKSNRVTVSVFKNVDRESALDIELWSGIVKGARMDYLMEKAVELGVARIQPVLTQYTALHRSDWRRKTGHWRGVIVSACEQSGRTRIPKLEEPLALRACAALTEDAIGLLFDPTADQDLSAIKPAPHKLTLLIGPEGGFSDAESAHAQALGFRRVRSGPRTLRTETAGVAAIVAAQLLWGDLR
jgi:16S rRNA (uracil1498-N3)-methyltransferase